MNYFLKQQDQEYGQCDGVLHEIKENDTLYKLSRLYQVPLNEIMDKNPMVDVYNLKSGDKLCIPMKHMPYIIKKGDHLDWILEHFDLDYDEFREANPQLSPIVLNENEIVYIPDKSHESRRSFRSVG